MEKSPLAMLAISDTGFVFDPRTGHSYTVNPSGLALLRSLKQTLDVPLAQTQLENTFDCRGDITSDVYRFVSALVNNDLLSADALQVANGNVRR